MSTAKRLVLLIILCLICWIGGFFLFIQYIPTEKPVFANKDDVKGIVVLTGGKRRIHTGVKLLTEYPKASLLISGVDKTTSLGTIIATNDRIDIKPKDRLAKRIITGQFATDTRTNALETMIWMELHQLDKAVVVTASYHVPRALYELKLKSPDKEFIPYPVLVSSFKNNQWWKDPTILRLCISEYHKYLAAHLRVYFLSA